MLPCLGFGSGVAVLRVGVGHPEGAIAGEAGAGVMVAVILTGGAGATVVVILIGGAGAMVAVIWIGSAEVTVVVILAGGAGVAPVLAPVCS